MLIESPKIIDLFAGPGGLGLAAQALRIPAMGIEWDGDTCETRRRAGLATTQADVRDYGPADFPSLNVLLGGPPMQTFSVAGYGTGRRALDEVLGLARRMAAGENISGKLLKVDDERTGLVLEPLRWVLEAIKLGRPYRAIVLEQMPAVQPVWAEYCRILEEKGYAAHHGVLHAEEFGVAQTRRRAVLIARLRVTGTSGSDNVEPPKPTHQRFRPHDEPQVADGSALPIWVAMGDVLNRPLPFEVVSHYGTGGDPRKRGRRTHAEPAFAVTGKVSRNRVIDLSAVHGPSDGRVRLEKSEAGVLQTFPASYPWAGQTATQQIGNAIPPRLGVHVLAAALRLGAGDIAAALKQLERPVGARVRPCGRGWRGRGASRRTR